MMPTDRLENRVAASTAKADEAIPDAREQRMYPSRASLPRVKTRPSARPYTAPAAIAAAQKHTAVMADERAWDR